MATNLKLNDRLIVEAMHLGGHQTREEAVSQALTVYVGRLKRLQILELFGTIDYDSDYDYKNQRRIGPR